MPAGTVEVFLIGATGIKNREMSRFLTGKADPYVILLCGRQKLKSNTANNQGSKPTWNQRFNFYIDDTTSELQLKIYDRNILLEDVELGTTIIPLAKVFAESKVPTTSYNVVPPSGGVKGEIKLSVSFTAKRKPGQQPATNVPGPYNGKVHGNSPYKPNPPPEPKVKHDPLTGPYGYYKTGSNASSPSGSGSGSSHGHSLHHPYVASDSDLGSLRPYPPTGMYASGPAGFNGTPSQYQRTDSGPSLYPPEDSFSSSSFGSSHGRVYPAGPPSTDYDYTGNAYTESPYGHLPGVRPTPPAPLGYPSVPSHGSSSFNRLDELSGRFGSMSVSTSDTPGYPRYPSFSNESRPQTGYPPPEPMDHHYHHPGLPPSMPPGGYPPPTSYPPPRGNDFGYEAPPSSFYPPQLGAPQQAYSKMGSLNSTSTDTYPPSPYYGAPPTHYIPAGYPK